MTIVALALVGSADCLTAQPNRPQPSPATVATAKVEKVREMLNDIAWSALQPASQQIEIRRPLMEMGEDAFPAFEVLLADRETKPHIVRAAIEVLIAIKVDRKRFTDLVGGRLADEDWGVQWKALVLLGQIGSEQDSAPVVALLSAKEINVHYAAADTLSKIGGKRELVAMNAWLKAGGADRKDEDFVWHVKKCRDELEKRLKDKPIPKDLKD
jgi:HEAT repeat protein